MMYFTNILLNLISTIFKTINSSVDDTRKTLALFNKDWNTYKTNWQKGFASNGFAGGVKSVFQSTKSVVSPEQIQMLRTWNNAVKHGCTNQETFNKIIANADHNTKMYFAGLNKGKGTLDGLKKAQNATKASTIGLTIAQTALNMAISMGLMAAISLAIKGFDKMMNSAKRASEAADEAFEETSSKVQEQQEELKTLDELISKYKELKKDGTLDIEGRKEVKELQNDIADLVGTQARNLDLVNGKLDDEIKKLDEISAKEAKTAYETATANYNNSQRAKGNATGDDSLFFFDGFAYTGKREKDAENILKEYGFGNNVRSGGFLGTTLTVRDDFDNGMNMLEGAQEKADYLQSMIDVLEQNGQRATELYSGLISQRDKYLGYIDSQQGAANSLVNSWITYSQYSNEELSNITVKSVESFEAYRQKMIEAAKNDESVGKLLSDGTLSEKDLETAVNDFMATSTKFSDWYKQWIGDVQDTGENLDKMTVSLSEMKTASDNISSLSSAFKELSDDGYLSVETISKIQEATKLSGDEWESYKLKLLNAKDGSVEFNQIMSEMTYKILDATFKKEGLVDATEDEIAAVLRENGVSNASAVAHDYLTRTISSEEKAKAENSIRTRLLSGDIAGLIENLSSEATACGLTEAAFKNLAIQMVLTNDTKMSFDDQIANLKALGVAAEITAAKMAGVNGYRNTKYSEKRNARGNMDSRGGLITNVGQETINGSTYIVYYGENGQVVDKEKIGVDYDNITVPNVTPNYSGATSGGKSGSNDAPDYEDPTDAIINRINLRAKELEQQEESIQNAIEIAELEKDHKKQISLTNDLITKRKDRLTELKTANSGLHNEAERLRNSTPQWNEEEWFDSQGNATKAYIDFINNRIKSGADKEEIDAIKDQFEAISKYKKAYMDNAEEIAGINKEILQDEEKIWDLRREEFDTRLEESEYYIQHSKDFGWENGDNEIAARKRVLEWIQSDYYKSLIKDDEEYYKILEEHRLKYNDTLKEMTDDLLNEFQAKLDETYDIRISRLNSKSSLLSSHFGVVNAIAEEQHNLNKELREAETIGARMSALERETLFSKSDHNRLSSKLSDIMFDINDLQRDYLRDLEHATEDTIEEVTNQYERQYELKMKEYEVVKAELNLIKKRQILENTRNEKSVRTWNGSEWIYEANLQDVLNAQEEVENAKHELARAQSEEAQQIALNAIDASSDALQTEKNKLTSAIEDMAEKMSGSGKEITSMLQTLAETDLPTFDAIIKALEQTKQRSLYTVGVHIRRLLLPTISRKVNGIHHPRSETRYSSREQTG